MTSTRCSTCGTAVDSSQMPDLVCVLYLRCIRLTNAIPALLVLADELSARFPGDVATPSLVGLIALKVARLESDCRGYRQEVFGGAGCSSSVPGGDH